MAAATTSTTDTITNATAKVSDVIHRIVEFLTLYAFQVIGAIIVLLAGLLVARHVGRMLQSKLEKKDMEPPVRMLIIRIVKLLIIAFTLVIAATQLGVAVMPLVAGLGVAGVGVGLAMQGVLGNLVAGLTIIFTKPFRVGDYIEIHGVDGQVEQIELFSTMLRHGDRSIVVIPNRKIVGEILHNYHTIRQLDLAANVAYDTNVPQAVQIVQEILKKNPRVVKDLTPGVGVSTLADSSIRISVRPWTSLADFGPAGGEIYQAILEGFRQANIELSLPQREIRIINGAAEGATRLSA